MKKLTQKIKGIKPIHILVFLLLIIILYLYSKNNLGVLKNNGSQKPTDNTAIKAGCTRTSRLDNAPVYDRALSIIQEKYTVWEKDKNSYGTWYFFPSQLVNCIKIIEDNSLNNSKEQGYFVFNDKDIKENYFPIYVSRDYQEADDLVAALLLVHEITHVQQYIDKLNDKPELSCIDKEVYAFDASFEFYRFQFDESGKSLQLRIQYDDKLHPQLTIIKTIMEEYSANLLSRGGLSNGNIGNIDEWRRNIIKNIVIQDESYQKQCNLN